MISVCLAINLRYRCFVAVSLSALLYWDLDRAKTHILFRSALLTYKACLFGDGEKQNNI